MAWKFPVVLRIPLGWTKPTIIPYGRMQWPTRSKPYKAWSALNFVNTVPCLPHLSAPTKALGLCRTYIDHGWA
eukprot:15337987-Ditylum_brightwellii.AAC.1